MTTKKKTAPEVSPLTAPTPSPLLDTYGNPGHVAPGALIESAWGNSLVDRAMLRFPGLADLNTSTPVNGTLAVTTDYNVIWIRDAGVWKPTSLGHRISFRVIGGPPGQSMGAGPVLGCTFQTVESDASGVTSGALFTCPPQWGGRWMFEWAVQWPVGGSIGARLAFLVAGGKRLSEINNMPLEGGTRLSGAASVVLTPGQTAQVQMYHTDTTATLAVNDSVNNYFQGYYVGSY